MLSKIRSHARGFSFPSWSVPIALLVLVLLSYGLRALSLGFYWDDWPYLWYFQRLGAAGIIDAFTKDRPFLSFIYIITLKVLGSSSQAWQIFALLARWLCSLSLWWVLKLTWPRHANKTVWAVFLFTVYPGFTQQWIAVIYGQAFILFASLFLSIGITLCMARLRSALPVWLIAAGTILALGLSGFTMFSTEYFFGLELLRPMLLWLILATAANGSPTVLMADWKKRLTQTTLWWLPYLLLMIVFVIWRGFIHIFPSATLSALQGVSNSPVQGLENLALTIIEDLVEASLAAWGQPLQLAGFIETGAGGLRLLAIILGVGVLFWLYLARLFPQVAEEDAPQAQDRNWAWQAILVGFLLFLAAGWPFWITGLPMRMGFPQDRYSLPLAPGLCLAFAGLVDLLGGQSKDRSDLVRKAAVIGIVLGLAAGFHSNLALAYRQDWNQVRNFFWQLTWRAPAVQPGTLFLTSNMPFQYYEDDSLSSPLNWTYDPDGHSKTMQYILYDMLVRKQSLPSLIPGKTVTKDFRATMFQGTTSQALVIYYNPPGCVHVLDPVYDAEQYNLPDRVQMALPLSNPRQWVLDQGSSAAPPIAIFGGEPKYRWCYYYEKAELARQQNNWGKIRTLANESIHAGYRPEDPAEYLPFIEGYTRLGYSDDAYQLTLSAYAASLDLQPALCAVWRRADQAGAKVREAVRQKLQTNLNCSIP